MGRAWRDRRRFLTCLVVGAAVAGIVSCSPGDGERSNPVELVADSLGHTATVTETQLECMQQHTQANPMLATELRRVRDFDELDAVVQSRAYEALAPCLPTALGRAVLTTFLDATGGSEGEFVSDSQAQCVSQSLLASKWLVDMRYAQEGVVMPSDEMRGIVSNLYLCARDVVVNGPLARALEIDREAAACAASRLEMRIDLVPEVAGLMFGQLQRERSAGLEQVLASCKTGRSG